MVSHRSGDRGQSPTRVASWDSMAIADLVSARERVRASLAHLETVPPIDGAKHRDPHGVWLLTITAAMLAGVFITAWLLTSVGGNLAATFAAAAVSVLAFLVVVTASRELADGQTVRTLSSLIATVVVCVSIVIASWSGALLRLKVQSSEGAWTHAALCALDDSGSASCAGVQSSRLNLPGFGPVVTITSMEPSQIIFEGPHNAYGLIYSPNAGEVGFDECVGHISGPWWQYGSGGPCSGPAGLPGEMHPAPMP